MPLALLLALAAAAQSAAAAPAEDRYAAGRAVVATMGQIATPNGLDETFEAQLGGVRQVVNVRGTDRANPIILFLHGGPGAVEIPIAWSFQRPWEDYFTVVQWDQRGAGRSYALTDPKTIAPTLTLERYRDDAIELIELLRQKYGKRKIVLVGHSWGSLLGLAVATARPDLLHAYVGMGQMIDFRENERAGYEWTLAEARRRGDKEAVAALEALTPYPGPGTLDIGRVDTLRKYSVRYGALAAYRDNADFYFRPIRLSPLYTPADIAAWQAGSAFSVQTFIPRMTEISFAATTDLRVPVVFMLGRHDYTTAAPLAAAWLAKASAPAKQLVWFEHSAHLPMVEEPGKMLIELVNRVRPLATEGRPTR